MIVYGVCVGPSGKFERFAAPSLKEIAGPDDVLITKTNQRSISEAYNSILDEAADLQPDAVVLLHDDVELRDLGQTVRLLGDASVGVVGAIGGTGQTMMGWWTAPIRRGRAPDTESPNDFGGGTHEVDSVDGLILALSPSVARSLRFDSLTFDGFHAYDADICAQARAAGFRVLVTEIDLFHHRREGHFLGDSDSYERNSLLWQIKWRQGNRRHQLRARLRLAALAIRKSR